MQFSRISGILAHPTCFPSAYGIGDLGNGAMEFVDFLKDSNQKLWQILPIGATSFGDSPYQSFSTFAGNPLLISPDLLLKENYLDSIDLEDVPDFSDLYIDYGQVIDYKEMLFRKAFSNFKKRASKVQRDSYLKFCDKNRFWLDDFVLFMSIKEYFIKQRKSSVDSIEFLEFKKANENLLNEKEILDFYFGAVWNSWPKGIKLREEHAIKKIRKKLKTEIGYYKFLQYEFFRQWFEVKEYANDNDIKIIGDIPIFVAMDSSDAWTKKELFFLDEVGYPNAVAGVPPDYFSEEGQLWGNPLYNWEEHKKSKYNWWIKRISFTLKFVDIIRIDHFIGFVRYWSVPYGSKNSAKGSWCNGPGFDFFEFVRESLGDLPIIAEDLGVVTEDVIKLRQDNGFAGTKVLQFAFDSDSYNLDLPHNYDSNNYIVYTGTHDNDTTLGWYINASEETKDLMRRYLNVSGDDAAWDLIKLAFSTTADVVIIPFQDLMNLNSNYRMNTPGVSTGNWKVRYKSDMLKKEISDGLKYLCKLFNRGMIDIEKTEKKISIINNKMKL